MQPGSSGGKWTMKKGAGGTSCDKTRERSGPSIDAFSPRCARIFSMGDDGGFVTLRINCGNRRQRAAVRRDAVERPLLIGREENAAVGGSAFRGRER